MPSMQEALVQAGLTTQDELRRHRAIKRIDDMIDGFEKVDLSATTLSLSLLEIGWRTRPENKGKSHEDFVVYARAQLIARI